MSIVPYYGGSLIQYLIMGMIFLVLSMVFSIFSPFGIFFIIFSIVRGKTESETLKKVSFVFQIILAVLTFLIGTLIALLFSISGSPIYVYSGGWIMTLAAIIGIGFVVAIEIGVIIWQSSSLKKWYLLTFMK